MGTPEYEARIGTKITTNTDKRTIVIEVNEKVISEQEIDICMNHVKKRFVELFDK